MANVLARLFVELGVNSASFSEGLQKASYQTQVFGKKTSQEFRNVGNSLAVMGGAFGAFGPKGAAVASAISLAGQAAGSAIEKFAKLGKTIGVITGIAAGAGVAALSLAGALATSAIAGAKVIERFSEMSKKTGIAVHDLQVFEAAGATVGVTVEAMAKAMKIFDERITGMVAATGLSKNVLEQLNVTSHDNKEALYEVADAFSRMADGSLKAAYASVLFGRSGLDMIPILDKGRQGIEDFEKDVDQYGPKIDASAIAANERWMRSTEDLSLSWDKAKVGFSGLLDVLSEGVGSLADFVASGDKMKIILAGIAQQAGLTTLSLRIMDSMFKDASKVDPLAGGFAAGNAVASQMQDQLNEKIKKQYEIMKAGSGLAYELEQKRADLATAISAGLYQQAIAIQKQVDALQAVIDRQNVQKKLFADMDRTIIEMHAGEGTAMRPKEKRPALQPMPDVSKLLQITSPATNAASTAMAATTDATQAGLTQGKNAVKEFWKEHQRGAIQTKDQINAGYQEEYARWFDLLQQKMISEQQFNTVVTQLESDREQKLRARFADFYNELDSALKSFDSELARFIVTGQRNFRKLGQTLEESFLKLGITNLQKHVEGGIAGLGKGGGGFLKGFMHPGGIGKLGTKSNPMIVQDIGKAIGAGIPGIGSGKIGGGFGGAFGQAGQAIGDISQIKSGAQANKGKAVTGAAAAVANIPVVGPFLATAAAIAMSALLSGLTRMEHGGAVTPGRSYIVGERRPELFVPSTSGRIIPNVPGETQGGGSQGHHVTLNTSIQALDSSGVEDILNSHAQAIADAVTKALRHRGDLTPSSCTS